MSLPQATPDRRMAAISAKELDWDALYSDQLPRIYNYFRFRVGGDTDAEDLTARTFESAWRARDSDLERLSVLAARLSEHEQELIALKYGAALDNRQISRLMRLSESNVGTLLHRAVQTLRSQW
jgi:RNA polymerase sigma-70 factor (ECF subfamily)